MRYDYVVILKRDNAYKTDLVSILLILFSILSFSYVQLREGIHYFLLLATLILISGLCIQLFGRKKKKVMHYRNWLLAAALFWLGMPYFQWLFIPFVLFAFLEAQAKYPLEIGFSSGGVVINTFFKRRISWNDLNTVILKDDMLTLDLKNNKLIQKEILEDEEPDAPEDEFNDYCRSKLVNL